MGRKKKGSFPPYQSAKTDCIELRFVRLGNSQLLHSATLSLNHLAFRVYVHMLLESGGNIEFTFPHAKYRKLCSNDGFQGALEELVAKGFVDIVQRNKNLRTANVYRFSERWKSYLP